jgi:hypothetical protein
MRYILDQAFLGQFVVGMHHRGASLMVILIFLHMARVFFIGAYKYPRADLDHRRRAADPDDGDGVHRLPAAVRPALLPGDERRGQHQPTGPFIGPYSSSSYPKQPERDDAQNRLP